MNVDDAVKSRIDKCGAIYTDDISRITGERRETITRWLKNNGFTKPAGGKSHRWINPAFSGANDASRKVVEVRG